MLEDAIGLLILVIVAIILLAFAGMSIVFSFELISSAISWFGQGPAIGWTVLGSLVGGLFGVLQGRKARGRADDPRKLYLTAGLLCSLLLLAGIFSPAGHKLLGW